MTRMWACCVFYLGTAMPLGCPIALGLTICEPVLAQTAQQYREKAASLARTRSWDEAIADYRKALALEPNDALSHYNLALALKYHGDTKQAVEEFETALRLKPNWADAHFGLGATLY